MKKKTLLLAGICIVCIACQNTEEKAAKLLETARETFAKGQYNEAKKQIDSIKLLYPKAFDTRHEGIRLMRQIEMAEQKHTLNYLDSLLSEEQAKFEQIKSHFAFEKDTAYQQIGRFLHPSQVIERNLHRSFLRFQVDENGQVSMTSIYCGPRNIHHTAVKVTASDGSFAQTPTSKDSYETTDLDEHIEKADYAMGADGNVIEFIALNQDKKLTATFIGDRTFQTVLTSTDRQAAAEIYRLGQLLSSITRIKKSQDECRLKIRFLEEKEQQS